MTREEKIRLIENVKKQYETTEKFVEDFQTCFGTYDTKLIDMLYEKDAELLTLTATILGDTAGWLNYWIHERGDYVIMVAYDIFYINTAEDVLELVEGNIT